MQTDTTLDVCGYINTVGISQSNNIAARNGLNFYELTDPASQAFILASDNMTAATTRRFEFNVGKLIGMYPDATAIPKFKFEIRGRKFSAGLVSAYYTLKFPNQKMIMQGSPGSYVPSIDPPGGPALVHFSSNVVGGGDGSIGIGIGSVIVIVTYDRATNAVSLTTF